MKTFFLTIAIAVVLLLNTEVCNAQIQPKALRVSLISEATTLPTYKVVKSPVHPGIMIGADFRTKQGKHWSNTLGVDLGYYYHKAYEHAVMLDGVYTLGYRFNFGLQINLLTCLGYKHSVLAGEVYKFEEGEYKKATHWGKAQFNGKLGLGLEFPINNKFSIGVNNRYVVALPYAPKKGMPFSIHSIFAVGVKMNLAGQQ